MFGIFIEPGQLSPFQCFYIAQLAFIPWYDDDVKGSFTRSPSPFFPNVTLGPQQKNFDHLILVRVSFVAVCKCVTWSSIQVKFWPSMCIWRMSYMKVLSITLITFGLYSRQTTTGFFND